MPHILVEDLWKIYPGNIVALRGVSFELNKVKLVILAGPNGAGKTTLVRIIDAEITPTRGRVLIDGLEPDEARARGMFGVMPQEAQLHEYLTVREYLYYLALIKGLSRQEAKREVDEIIELFLLQDCANRKIETLSGGYKRRVLLAQAFIGKPEVLILDEPTVGLDPEMRVKLWQIILNYLTKHNALAIVVTHYLDEVKDFANSVLILHKGRLIFHGSPRELLRKIGYSYRVRIRITSGKALSEIPVSRYCVISEREIELYVSDDLEMLKVLQFVREHREYIADLVIDRPSLEESYMKVIAHDQSS